MTSMRSRFESLRDAHQLPRWLVRVLSLAIATACAVLGGRYMHGIASYVCLTAAVLIVFSSARSSRQDPDRR